MIGLDRRSIWEICRKYGIEVKEKWYEHRPEVVMENDKCKILWD